VNKIPPISIFLLACAALLVPVQSQAELPRTGLASTGYSATLFDGYIPLSPPASSTTATQPGTGTQVIDMRPRSYQVLDRESCLKELRWSSAGWASLGGAVLGGVAGMVGFMATPPSRGNPYGLLLIGAGTGAAVGAVVGYFVIDERKCSVTTRMQDAR